MALHSRRDVLRLGSAAAATSLAGCASLPFVSRPKLTLTVINRREERCDVDVQLWRTDGSEKSELNEFSERYRLPASSEGSGATDVTDSDVAPARPYLVLVEISSPTVSQFQTHYHYFPDCTKQGFDEREERTYPVEHLYVEVDSATPEADKDLYVTFHGNGCSDDSIYL